MHPSGSAHGGSGILIKNNVSHHEGHHFSTPEFQATNVIIDQIAGPLQISAVYSPPRHTVKKEDYIAFFKTLGNRFLAGGDYNAKHINWGSRLTSPKGRQMLLAINSLTLNLHSTGEPTYWPTDPRKVPDLIDFFVSKSISPANITCSSSADLSSDHSPVFLNLNMNTKPILQQCHLHNSKTDWNLFKTLVSESLNSHISLKSDEDIVEAVEHFNHCIQNAAWESTPLHTQKLFSHTFPKRIVDLIALKRKARKTWQQTRYPRDKKILNHLSKSLKIILQTYQNTKLQNYLENLEATEKSDYSLWKATKFSSRAINSQPPIKTHGNQYAKTNKEKAEVFATHLDKVFTPHDIDPPSAVLLEVNKCLNEPHQLDLPIKKFSVYEVKKTINSLKTNKSPGYDLITSKILKELPNEGFYFLTCLFNSILVTSFVPPQWKTAQMKMIIKPGKPPEETNSYRPISLLSITSKTLETLFLSRLTPFINNHEIIPDHQFGFRKGHGTVEQVHRVVNCINKALDEKKYCTAVFLDISQAFDKVWHDGLLFKIKKSLPINYYLFIKSYLSNRRFFVKQGCEITNLHEICAGVPQGSIMGPLLYLLFTHDLPLPNQNSISVGTFADDTVALSSHKNADVASNNLQKYLDSISTWLMQWKIRANEAKSVHVTFTTKREISPPVTLNGIPIPQSNEAKYLGLYLDQKLTWKHHIFTKRKALGLKLRSLFQLLGPQSKLSLSNKLLLYKTILKPIWTYGVQLWGTAASSNIEIIQRFQSKILRIITNAPLYITNDQLHKDLRVPTVREEIKKIATSYHLRISHHVNPLMSRLMHHNFSRLQRRAPQDLI